MFGWHHRLDRHEFEQALGDSEGQGSLVCCSSWGCKELDMTQQLNNNKETSSYTLTSSKYILLSFLSTIELRNDVLTQKTKLWSPKGEGASSVQHTLLYIKQINNKVLLYQIGNYIQCLVIKTISSLLVKNMHLVILPLIYSHSYLKLVDFGILQIFLYCFMTFKMDLEGLSSA